MLQHLPQRSTLLSSGHSQPWSSHHPTNLFIQQHEPISRPYESASALQLGIGGGILEGTAATSGLLGSSLGQMALPAVSISALMLLLLWLEVRFHHHRETSHTHKVLKDLEEHRREKRETLRHLFLPMVALMGTGSLLALFTGQSWTGGPSPHQLGSAFAFYTSYIALDTAMDECGPTKPRMTTAAALVFSLFFITKLTTRGGGGHLIFTLRAIDVLISTVLAGTADTLLWKGLAAVGMGLIGGSAMMGWFPHIPVGASLAGIGSYALVSTFGTFLYQIFQQQSSSANSAQVRLCKSGLNVLAMLWGLPPTWSMFCAGQTIVFFGLKVLVDSVGIHACKARLRSKETDAPKTFIVNLAASV